MGPKAEITFESSHRYNRYLFPTDANGSRSIDSQAEFLAADEAVFRSGDPVSQLYFSEGVVPIASGYGWSIPASHATAYERLRMRHLSAEEQANEAVGCLDVFMPITMDIASLADDSFLGGSLRTDANGNQSLVDESGNTIALFTRGPNGNLSYISSSLSKRDLSLQLLWMPSSQYEALSFLLGLPRPRDADVLWSTNRRLSWETSPNRYEKATPDDAFSDTGLLDGRFSRANTIRGAVLAQQDADVGKIDFPGFGVALAAAPKHRLKTGELLVCSALAIYDRRAKQALLAHLIPGDVFTGYHSHGVNPGCEILVPPPPHALTGPDRDDRTGRRCRPMGLPAEWYLEIFRQEYFSGADDRDLEVTIISNDRSHAPTLTNLVQAALRFFPQATVQHLKAHAEDRMTIEVDAQTGALALFDSSCSSRGQCQEFTTTPPFERASLR